MRALLIAPLLALALSPAHAQSPTAALAAQQATGLFLASCLSYASNAAALRAWATGLALPPLPPQATEAFLKGTPGTAYDASNPTGQYVVLSHDDGACAVLVRGAEADSLIPTAEATLAGAGVVAILATERADAEVAGARHRVYHAAAASRSWTIVLSLSPGQALLSATAR